MGFAHSSGLPTSKLLPTALHGNYVCKAGIFIANVGFLASSPDVVVFDSEGDTLIGIIEIKCPYSCRENTAMDVKI